MTPLSNKRTFSEALKNTSSHDLFVVRNLKESKPPLSSRCLPRKTAFELPSPDTNCDSAESDTSINIESGIQSSPYNGQSQFATANGLFPRDNSTAAPFSTDEDDDAFVDSFNTVHDLENYRFSVERRRTLSRPGSFSIPSRRNVVSKTDLVARERCFDYIVQSIDEVWARYCDTTACAEAEAYGDWNTMKRRKLSSSSRSCPEMSTMTSLASLSHKPLRLSEGEESEESDQDEANSGYKSEGTNITEYETDSSEYRMVSKLPDSVKLESLKCRLTKAKNYLEQFYDSDDYADCIAFWKRWDMIKYSAVEVMEDDDDDEVVEHALKELEEGRCFID
ncbi:uncharacterized protein KNAG_0C00280 [Huiozyma naganishii CBS 8797]|uniref:Uncharacterized protein n=1 Tax=Huiozyma naganishii (strain ATCC MYA-139 / BCRC 22969 / CBS 8797 / KCTC 17520 / NBRC 10181 / NCYC 3082 / Yp74L-3) TaxID=1071383 RepID=J7S5G9_HUIN7|nr:hypothetical protein KNAG_0C00280 [Kazachstania naganishii CBS 8797]CCK69141.1 hypothetical protein KNAG_0C00280 [Kazachstania naganishii CBS 8797]